MNRSALEILNFLYGRLRGAFWIVLFISISGMSAHGQSENSEIYTIGMSDETGKLILSSELANISNSPGYDNQPSFGQKGGSVLFTSQRNGKSFDIYEFDLSKSALTRITNADDNEYTARERSEDVISFVREGPGQTMSVWQYDRKTREISSALTSNEPVAYYDWDRNGGALVWVRYAFMARYMIPSKNINLFVSDAVQPSTPQRIPGTDRFSFVYRRPDGSLWIKEFDPETRSVRPITQVKDNNIDYCWWDEKTMIAGSGSKLIGFTGSADDEWFEIGDLGGLGIKKITRVAASKERKLLAFVGISEKD